MQVITRQEAREQGLKYYFTGKPCKRGHLSVRSVGNASCKQCRASIYAENKEVAKESALAWYYANKERAAKRSKSWYDQNKEDQRTKCKARYWADPSAARSRNRQYAQTHKSQTRQRQLRWDEQNPGAAALRAREWRESNKEHAAALAVASAANRRATMAKARIPLTEDQKRQVRAIYRLRSAISRATGVEYHVDHRVPISKGGLHEPSNLWVIPAAENLRKSARLDWNPAAA